MLLSIKANAQDTIFIRSLELPIYSDNISTDGESLFIRSADSIYSWNESKLEFVSKAALKYSWYNANQDQTGFIHSNDIPQSSLVNKKIETFIPGPYNGKITSAKVDENLYISFNGTILQYKIAAKIERFLKGVSVRHIYWEPQVIKVFSTYSGVFVLPIYKEISKSTLTDPIARYSSGSFTKIKDRYFLCQNDLIEYIHERREIKRRIEHNDNPRFRQLFEFNDKVFSVMTKGVNRVNLERFEFDQYFLEDEEITSYKVIDSVVVFGSRKNGIYIMDTLFSLRRINAPKNINDLILDKEDLIICTDNGLYRLKLNSGKYKQLTSEKYLHTIVKFKSGFIYSGDRGLYWYNGTQATSLVKDVEFNKLALLITSGHLYAGSINGLYKISVSDLQFLTNTSSSQFDKKGISGEKYRVAIYYILAMIIVLLGGIIGYMFFRKNRKSISLDKAHNITREEITFASVKQIILQNESIKSVEDIARYYSTSVSQVNRRLKLEKTSPLKCLKETKREIVIQMKKDGKSIEEMSKRVGYSKRYIKENFLKE